MIRNANLVTASVDAAWRVPEDGQRLAKGDGMKRWGLPEYLGIVVALVCFTWWSPVNDYLAGPKLLVLVAGGLGALPAIVYRWRQGKHPRGVVFLPAIAALGLVAWSGLSMLLSGAPFPVSLMGWWGRSNGFLSLLGAGLIMLAATTLRRDELPRVVTWQLVGATAISLIGLAQLGGNQVVGGLPDSSLIATMGNTNFSAAYFGIMTILALGRALTKNAPTWQRAWAGGLAVVLVALAYLTRAEQGPASIAIGGIAMLAFWALTYDGERRRAALATAGAAVVVAAGVTLSSFVGLGPLAFLWQDANFRIRQGTWLTAWDTARALPVFGTGPDGLQRYANQYSPDFYIDLVGTRITLSAAHNVPLQYAATLGLVAGLIWVLAMFGAAVLLLLTMARYRVADAIVAASVGGAFVAYLTQAMVSIDMGGLLATGWLLLGLVVALLLPLREASEDDEVAETEEIETETEAQPDSGAEKESSLIGSEEEPAVTAEEQAASQPVVARTSTAVLSAPAKRKGQPRPKKGSTRSASRKPPSASARKRAPERKPSVPLRERFTMETPVWVPVSGAILATIGAIGVGQTIMIDSRTSGNILPEQLISLLESPWTPCASRIPLVQVAVRDLPPEQSVPATYAAADIDPRCDTITNFQGEIAIQNQQVEIADRATAGAITFNPDNNISWILRSRYHLLVGDLAAAEADYATAADVTARFPGNEAGAESLQRLRADLDAATAAPAG